MQTLVIDTNGVVKKLEQRGFSRTQAEGITEALKELDASNLATKTDLEVALAKQTRRRTDRIFEIVAAGFDSGDWSAGRPLRGSWRQRRGHCNNYHTVRHRTNHIQRVVVAPAVNNNQRPSLASM